MHVFGKNVTKEILNNPKSIKKAYIYEYGILFDDSASNEILASKRDVSPYVLEKSQVYPEIVLKSAGIYLALLIGWSAVFGAIAANCKGRNSKR